MEEVPPALAHILKKITQGRVQPEELTMNTDLFLDLHLSKEEFQVLLLACEQILRFIFVPSFQPLQKREPSCTLQELVFYAQPFYLLRPPPTEAIDLMMEYLLPPAPHGCFSAIGLFLAWLGYFFIA